MKNLKRLFAYLRPYRWKFVFSNLCIIIYTLSRATQPFLIGLSISSISKDIFAGRPIQLNYVARYSLLLIITGLLDAGGEYIANHCLTDVIQNAIGDMRKNIASKMNRLPVSFFDRHQQGEILSRITTDVDVISNAMQQGIMKVFGSILILVFSFVFMFISAPFFALIALFFVPICLWAYGKFTKKSTPLFKKLQDGLGDLSGFTNEYYSGYEVVQLFGQEEEISKDFAKITERIYKVGFRSNFIASCINPVLSYITHIFYIGLFIVMAFTILTGPLTIGGFVLAKAIDVGILQSFIQYVWQAGGPIRDITQLSNTFQAAAASLTRVFALLDETEESLEQETHQLKSSNKAGSVDFTHVRFGYREDRPLMKNVNIHVKRGDMVAVVGPTGAGKTTLINLLMRFYDITGGEIQIDGVSSKELTRKQVRSFFGMVLQDPWLYSASIADNIRFGKLDATMDEIIEAAKTANVDRYIRTLPEGYDTIINEESSNISQGQKQLITIARALIGNPNILILDEATSSVDTRLEFEIQMAMKKAMENRTSFIIAHRLSTIREADLILVMNQGAIIEQGTHEELLKQNGMYKALYESQFAEE